MLSIPLHTEVCPVPPHHAALRCATLLIVSGTSAAGCPRRFHSAHLVPFFLKIGWNTPQGTAEVPPARHRPLKAFRSALSLLNLQFSQSLISFFFCLHYPSRPDRVCSSASTRCTFRSSRSYSRRGERRGVFTLTRTPGQQRPCLHLGRAPHSFALVTGEKRVTPAPYACALHLRLCSSECELALTLPPPPLPPPPPPRLSAAWLDGPGRVRYPPGRPGQKRSVRPLPAPLTCLMSIPSTAAYIACDATCAPAPCSPLRLSPPSIHPSALLLAPFSFPPLALIHLFSFFIPRRRIRGPRPSQVRGSTRALLRPGGRPQG